MKSYSIALLFHSESIDHDGLLQLEAFRRTLPFASIYLYCGDLESGIRTALQKQDVVIRKSTSDNRFRLIRQMFTEVDADIFVFAGKLSYKPETVSAMIHHLVEERKDMVVAASDEQQHAHQSQASRKLCQKLYGTSLTCPLSELRVFSRRFVKSYSAFERGFPAELEWSIHAHELDIPLAEHPVEFDVQPDTLPHAKRPGLTRFILNLQARPLKWFGVATAINLSLMIFYKVLFCLSYFGFGTFIDMTHSAMGAGVFAILSFVSALSGLTLHSISHQKRELKRLHFQQHTTL